MGATKPPKARYLEFPKLPKWLLETSRQCQEGVGGSRGELGAAKQESQGLPGDTFGLPRGCLGRLWDLPGIPPGAILEQSLIPNSMILLQRFLKPFFRSFKAKFHVFVFCPTLQIHCNLQWNLHVFRFGPFQKSMQNLYRKNMQI